MGNGKLCLFITLLLAHKFKMKKPLSAVMFTLLLVQLSNAYARVDGLPEGVSVEQESALFEAPTVSEVEAARLLDDEQLVDGEQLPNVLLSKEQIKRAKQAIKELSISDFILQRYDSLQTPRIVDFPTTSQFSGNTFPSLTTSNQNVLQFSQLLFNDFAKQAQSLSLATKLPKLFAHKIESGWDTGAWQADGENAIKNPSLDDLSGFAKVWAGPVVNDNVVRYRKKEDKTIARIYFNNDEYGRYSEPTKQLMQGIWALAKLNDLGVAVSIDNSTNAYELSYPLQFNLRLPLQIVTPDGLVPATLVSARLNNSGECNMGNWLELELADEKPISMWAFLAFPVPELAKSTIIKRETYTPDTFISDQEYMVGERKMLALSWKNQVLPPLKIVATRFDYNLEEYDDKGKLKRKSTLGSAWGSEVFLDNKVVTKVKDYQNKIVDSVNYGKQIHAGEFGDCPTR